MLSFQVRVCGDGDESKLVASPNLGKITEFESAAFLALTKLSELTKLQENTPWNTLALSPEEFSTNCLYLSLRYRRLEDTVELSQLVKAL
jgi:hypothetical protein